MSVDKRYKYSDITEKIIRCAMNVHNYFGSGFPEIIYQRALEKEFEKNGLKFQKEIEQPVFYYNEKIGSRRVDFLVEGVILLELKAVTELTSYYFSQILNYIKAFNLEVGLLINFGEKSLRFKRFVLNSKHNVTSI
jgi:GxxExxY protein